MLHSRTLNTRINNVYKRALRLTYKQSSFKELLQTIHHKNVKDLVAEIFKNKDDLAPDIMKNIFGLKEPLCNLRSESNCFTRQSVKTAY